MKKSIYVLIMALMVGIGAKVEGAVWQLASGDLSGSSAYTNASFASGDIIELTNAAGSYTWTTKVTALTKSLTIRAAAGLATRPVVDLPSGVMLASNGNTTPITVSFEGIEFNGAGVATGITTGKSNNVSPNTGDLQVSMNNCYVRNMGTVPSGGLFVYSGTGHTGPSNYSGLSISNSIFEGMAYVVYGGATGAMPNSITLTNCYFSNITTKAVNVQIAMAGGVSIDHCTFDNCAPTSGSSGTNLIFEVGVKASVAIPTIMKNTLFANRVASLTNSVNSFGVAVNGSPNTNNAYFPSTNSAYYPATITGSGGTAAITSDPVIVSRIATGAAYLTGGTDGKTIGYYNATPGAPTTVTATGGNTQASVAFSAPVNNGGFTITSYKVTSSPGGFSTTGSSSPLIVTGLSNGTAYTFTVVATNSFGNSAASNTSNSVTPSAGATATITGTATATAFTTTYGTASAKQDFTVSSSDLSVDITATAPTGFEVASDGATYGATATLTKNISGTLSLRLKANAAVSGSYNGVTVSLESTGATTKYITTAASGNTVTAKALTITAANQTVSYGTEAGTVTGAGTYTATGFVNSETASVITGSATYSTTYTNSTAAETGGVTITPIVTGLTATNYSFTPADGTITVTAANPTVTVTPIGTYTYSGSPQGPIAATTTGTGSSFTFSYAGTGNTTYGPSATLPTNAGTYTATATIAANGNFAQASSSATAFSILSTGAVSAPNTNISSLTLSPSSVLTVAAASTLVVDLNKTVSSVTVAQGGSLTVNSGVTLGGTVTLQSTTDGTATLVDKYATPTQAAVVEQHVSEGRNWYVSAPISAAGFGTLSLGNSVVEWNEVTKLWDTKSSGTLVPGKGYIQVATAVQGTTGTLSFDGIANSGDITVTLSRTGTNSQSGFNLVGNPYPSYLSWSKITKLNTNVMSTAWFRTKTTGGAYVFATVNAADTSSVIVVTNNANTMVTNYIPPMQAYWVRLNAASPTSYTVNNSMRSHADNGSNKMKAPKLNTQQLVRLQVSNAVTTDEAVVYFNANAADGYDNYDSPKMSNNSATIPEIYTLAGTEKLVVNGMNTVQYDTEIPLGFVTGTAGNFSISRSEMTNFEAGTRIMLIDKLNPTTEFELTDGVAYNFSAPITAASTSRFSLLFRAPGTTTGIKNNEKLNAQVYVNAANQITIIAPEKSNYAIYNAVGQLIENGTVNSKLQTVNCKLQTGIYVVKVNNQSTRVIIK
jgi:hypothetical protein